MDDLFITGNNDDYIASIKRELKKGFDMTYLRLLHYYLGIEVDKKTKAHFYFSEKICWRVIEQIWYAGLHQWSRI